MPQGGRLSISTEKTTATHPEATGHSTPRSGEMVCLTIRDTGSGIPPNELARIFEPFFTTKALPNRSGLGLALVYGIVKQHHGWTEARSEVGQGTAFKVFLPAIVRPVVLADPPRSLPVHSANNPSAPQRGIHVTFDEAPSSNRAVFLVNTRLSEPPSHWGINE